MPPRLTWEENPKIERHGFTDYLETNKGWKPIRVSDGRGQGRFRLTRVGKRYYHKNTLNEYVIQLPALFRTYKVAGEDPVEHRGFYPIHALPPGIRARLDLVFEGNMQDGRAAEIDRIKDLIKKNLPKKFNPSHFYDYKDVFSALIEVISDGDVVMIKGSNSSNVNKISEKLLEAQ